MHWCGISDRWKLMQFWSLEIFKEENVSKKTSWQNYNLNLFLLTINPVLCPGGRIVLVTLTVRPYLTKFKGSGVRIKMADDCGFADAVRKGEWWSDTRMRIEPQRHLGRLMSWALRAHGIQVRGVQGSLKHIQGLCEVDWVKSSRRHRMNTGRLGL